MFQEVNVLGSKKRDLELSGNRLISDGKTFKITCIRFSVNLSKFKVLEFV